MSQRYFFSIALLLCAVLNSCQDEDPVISASVIGKWNGNEADFKINPSGIIPAFTLHEDEFPVQLEFKTGGTLVLTDNKGVSREGIYSLAGDKLTIGIDYSFEMIDLSGTYQLNKLTSTNLEVEIEKDGSYTHPDTGQQFDGKVTATLYFNKTAN